MFITRIIPRKFGSRLLLMTLFTGLIPVIIFTLLIRSSGERFKNEINQTVESGRDQEWVRSEALLRLQGEELIQAKARDVAMQLNLVLRSVPWMTLRDLQLDGNFREVAVQRVGRTGYTILYETRSGVSRFDRDRKYQNVNLRRFSKTLPAFWEIVRKSLRGKSAGGYYDWKEPDGSIRQKYMYAIPLTVPTGDDVRLTVAATAYVDEFTQAIREAKAIHQDTTRFLMGTINASVQAFRKTGLVVMGLGIIVASLLALCVGRYFSKTIGRLRDATSRVNSGDYAVRVRSSMSGEIGTLVADFNSMVGQLEATTVSKHRLEESEEKLKQTNTELLREIVERARAEGALAAETERLTITLRSIGEGVITTDQQGVIVLMNESAEALTGWLRGEAVGRDVTEVFCAVDEETENPCSSPVGMVIESGQATPCISNKVLLAKGGEKRLIADSASPVRDPDGSTIGAVLVFRDIADERKLEEERLRLRKLESIATLAGGVAHDFNNLLTVILGNIGFAELFIDPQGKAFEKLNDAEKATERAKELTDQLLTFARGAGGPRTVVQLNGLITRSAEEAVAGSGVTCRFSLADDLYPVEVNEQQMGQVIHNLISNAREAMPHGGTIDIHAESVTVQEWGALPLKEGDYVKITVEDKGAGLSLADIQKIFDPYFTTKELGSQKGMGLGLTICYSIVRNHGGFITATSEVGTGTAVYIYLPAYQSEASRLSAEKGSQSNIGQQHMKK
jgi:PAS domain S-box-containing protein